jgi:hypothetical protein
MTTEPDRKAAIDQVAPAAKAGEVNGGDRRMTEPAVRATWVINKYAQPIQGACECGWRGHVRRSQKTAAKDAARHYDKTHNLCETCRGKGEVYAKAPWCRLLDCGDCDGTGKRNHAPVERPLDV